MRIKLLLIVLLCIIPLYPQWQVLGPSPIYEPLTQPYFIDRDKGFVGAGEGILYKTSDGFNTFEKIYTGAEGGLRQMQFTDEFAGYIIMYDNINFRSELLKTTDAGISWLKISNPLVNFPISLSFISRDSGFISTQDHILFTSDAGVNWEIRSGLSGRIKFIDSFKGFMIREWNILKTTNGGINWNMIIFPEDIYEVAFQDDQRIVILSDNNIILTSNGGSTWTQKSIPYYASSIHEILFQDSTIILMSRYAYRSDDLGDTWITIFSPDHITFTTTYCLKDKYYRFGRGGTIISSIDSGQTWKNLGSSHGGYKIVFTDSLNGFTAPWYYTSDGGWNWEYKDQPGLKQDPWEVIWYDYHFFTPSRGIVAKYNYFLETSDGGKTWDTTFTTDTLEIFQELYFVDSTHGFALMARHDGTQVWESGIRRSTDGGKNWSEFYHTPGSELEGLYFPTRNLGFVRNRLANGAYRTSDGGLTWNLTQFGNSSIHLYDSLNGFALIFYNAQLLKTTDGGLTSTLVSQQSSGYHLYFIDSLTGWSTISGAIYMTQDGGLTWQQEFQSLYQIKQFKMESNTLFAVGEFGSLFKRTGIVTEVQPVTQTQPVQFILYPNYPNPFNPSTLIRYSLPYKMQVDLTVYDMLGREVTRLVNQEQSEGLHQIEWNGSRYTSGVYICRLNAGGSRRTMKMTMIK